MNAITIVVTEHGHELPATVLNEVFSQLLLMAEGGWCAEDTLAQAAGQFEGSVFTLGFSAEETAEVKQYHEEGVWHQGDVTIKIWDNVIGGTPVGRWATTDSSMASEMVLYIMPDGHFEWTEP